MVELAVVLPILLILLLGAIDYAQVLSAQQRLENAVHVAALRLVTSPGVGSPASIISLIQTESGLSPVSAGASYSIGGAGADQVLVTATYTYPLLLPGLRNLQIGGLGNGTFKVSASAAGVATTNPPIVSDTSGTITVMPPAGTTVPSGLTLTCSLYQNGTPVPTPQPCPASTAPTGATWSHPTAVATYTYTATVMQVNGITSAPSTPATGP